MKFYQNIIIKFISQAFKIIPFIGINIIIAKLLGPEKKGEYELIILIPVLVASLANFGLPVSNVYFITKAKNSIKKIIGNTILINSFISVIFVVTLFHVLPFLCKYILQNIDLQLSRLVLISIFFLLSFNSLTKIFEGKKNFFLSSIYELFYTYIWFFLLLLIVFIKRVQLNTVVYIWIISIIFPFFALIIHLLKKYFIGFSLKLFKKQLSYGFIINLAMITSFLNYRLDIFLLGTISGLFYTGIYSIAVFGAEIIWRPVMYIANVLLPTSSSNTLKDNNYLTPIICRISFTISLIASLFGLVLGKYIIKSVLGISYASAYYSFIILLPGICIFSILRILAIDLIGRGKILINMYISLLSLIINIILNLIFIPLWKEKGASFSTTISYTLSSFVIIFYFKIKRGFRLIDMFLLKKKDIILLIDILKKIKDNNFNFKEIK